MKTLTTYSQLSILVGSTPVNLTMDRKYSEKKIPENSKKQNWNLLQASNYLHSICIVFPTIYITFTLY